MTAATIAIAQTAGNLAHAAAPAAEQYAAYHAAYCDRWERDGGRPCPCADCTARRSPLTPLCAEAVRLLAIMATWNRGA